MMTSTVLRTPAYSLEKNRQFQAERNLSISTANKSILKKEKSNNLNEQPAAEAISSQCVLGHQMFRTVHKVMIPMSV